MIKEAKIVGVRFTDVGKIYHFGLGEIADVQVGDAVIVETSRGWQLGFVASLLDSQQVKRSKNLKLIDRKATPRDLIVREMWKQKELDVVEYCRKQLKEINLDGVKIISAEYSFDGKRLAIFYSTADDGKVDIKRFRKTIVKRFSSARVDIRPMGPRDVAKTICGLGACGKEERCCCSFLSEFSSISIRMAKTQGISLTPSEITGMCGRLRCCLLYENEQYVEAMKNLPRRNKRLKTTYGDARVIEVRPLQDEIVIDIKEVGKKVFTKEEYLKILL